MKNAKGSIAEARNHDTYTLLTSYYRRYLSIMAQAALIEGNECKIADNRFS